MTPSLEIGNGNWAVKSDSLLGYKTINGKYYPREMSVVRATTGTRVNADGLVELVPYNLFQYSEQFDNAIWSKARISAFGSGSIINDTIAPNGTLTADYIQQASGETVTGGVFVGASYILGQSYTLSVYAKKKENNYLRLGFAIGTGGEGKFGNFDLNTGVPGTPDVGVTQTIQDVGNGWYRCSITATSQVTTTANTFIYNSSTLNSLTTTPLQGIYIWGAQLVEGSVAKDYLPTTDRLDIARIDYSTGEAALLVEPQRTNLLTFSDNTNSWAQSNIGSINSDFATSPTGIINADKINFNSGDSYVRPLPQGTISTVSSSSFFVKYVDYAFFQIMVASDGLQFANFDIQNGVIGTVGTNASASIENYGNGWYRIILRTTGGAFGSSPRLYKILNLSAVWAGGGGVAGSALVWGAQLEAGAYATSYIPTTSASVTRNQDVISKTGISSLLNPSEGTLFVEAAELKDNANKMFQITNGTDLNTVSVEFNNNTLRVGIVGGGGGYRVSNIPTNLYGFNKIAIGWISGNISCFVNGVQYTMTLYTGSGDGIPTQLDRITFSYWWAGGPFYVNTKTIEIWKTRLTNDQLAELTSL
jgi:hypothetical protein